HGSVTFWLRNAPRNCKRIQRKRILRTRRRSVYKTGTYVFFLAFDAAEAKGRQKKLHFSAAAHRAALSIFDYYGFYNIRRILALIGYSLHHPVDIPFFDDLLGIRLHRKKTLDAHVENVVGLILDAVDPHQRVR